MKTLFPIVATLLVLAISGCAPQVDIEAEEAAIREMDVEWMNAANAKDVERLVQPKTAAKRQVLNEKMDQPRNENGRYTRL